MHARTRTRQCVCLYIAPLCPAGWWHAHQGRQAWRQGAAGSGTGAAGLLGLRRRAAGLGLCLGLVSCPWGAARSCGAVEGIPPRQERFPLLTLSPDCLLLSFLTRGPPLKMGFYSVACFSCESRYCRSQINQGALPASWCRARSCPWPRYIWSPCAAAEETSGTPRLPGRCTVIYGC